MIVFNTHCIYCACLYAIDRNRFLHFCLCFAFVCFFLPPAITQAVGTGDRRLIMCLIFVFPPRRLNLADIERTAPLEEGALPYHLAEAQRQVGMEARLLVRITPMWLHQTSYYASSLSIDE